ncbi:MAG: hypothetical protein AAFY88_26120 [Acidobacteriota bacterium]
MTERPTLFFKPTCPPCGWMSKLAVVLSLGVIRRVPIDSEEAAVIYRDHPGRDGQLMLREGRRVTFQRRVFAAVPRIIVTAGPRLVGRRLAALTSRAFAR